MTDRAFTLGPLKVDMNVSVGGLLIGIMALLTMIGGWYHFQYTQQDNQKRIITLEREHADDVITEDRIADTLDRISGVLRETEQALEDNHIHVRDGIDANAPYTH